MGGIASGPLNFSHNYQCTDNFLMNLELLNFLFIWKTQPIVHEELELETPKHCFFGSIRETFGEMAEGVSVMLGNVPERMNYKILWVCHFFLCVVPIVRLGGHASDSFSVHTVSHALISIDVIVGHWTNGCLWIHERKFCSNVGKEAVYKGQWIRFGDDLLER